MKDPVSYSCYLRNDILPLRGTLVVKGKVSLQPTLTDDKAPLKVINTSGAGNLSRRPNNKKVINDLRHSSYYAGVDEPKTPPLQNKESTLLHYSCNSAKKDKFNIASFTMDPSSNSNYYPQLPNRSNVGNEATMSTNMINEPTPNDCQELPSSLGMYSYIPVMSVPSNNCYLRNDDVPGFEENSLLDDPNKPNYNGYSEPIIYDPTTFYPDCMACIMQPSLNSNMIPLMQGGDVGIISDKGFAPMPPYPMNPVSGLPFNNGMMNLNQPMLYPFIFPPNYGPPGLATAPLDDGSSKEMYNTKECGFPLDTEPCDPTSSLDIVKKDKQALDAENATPMLQDQEQQQSNFHDTTYLVFQHPADVEFKQSMGLIPIQNFNESKFNDAVAGMNPMYGLYYPPPLPPPQNENAILNEAYAVGPYPPPPPPQMPPNGSYMPFHYIGLPHNNHYQPSAAADPCNNQFSDNSHFTNNYPAYRNQNGNVMLTNEHQQQPHVFITNSISPPPAGGVQNGLINNFPLCSPQSNYVVGGENIAAYNSYYINPNVMVNPSHFYPTTTNIDFSGIGAPGNATNKSDDRYLLSPMQSAFTAMEAYDYPYQHYQRSLGAAPTVVTPSGKRHTRRQLQQHQHNHHTSSLKQKSNGTLMHDNQPTKFISNLPYQPAFSKPSSRCTSPSTSNNSASSSKSANSSIYPTHSYKPGAQSNSNKTPSNFSSQVNNVHNNANTDIATTEDDEIIVRKPSSLYPSSSKKLSNHKSHAHPSNMNQQPTYLKGNAYPLKDKSSTNSSKTLYKENIVHHLKIPGTTFPNNHRNNNHGNNSSKFRTTNSFYASNPVTFQVQPKSTIKYDKSLVKALQNITITTNLRDISVGEEASNLTNNRVPESPDYGLGSDVESALNVAESDDNILIDVLSNITDITISRLSHNSAVLNWKLTIPIANTSNDNITSKTIGDVSSNSPLGMANKKFILSTPFEPSYKVFLTHKLPLKKPKTVNENHNQYQLLSYQQPYGDCIYNGFAPICTLDHLIPFTEYEVRVCAYYDSTCGRVSQTHTFQTLPYLPTTPEPPILINKNKSSLTLKWMSPWDNGAKITGYTLQMAPLMPGDYQLNQILPDASLPRIEEKYFVNVYVGDAKQFKVTKLYKHHLTAGEVTGDYNNPENSAPASSFAFRLSATNSIGTSDFSDPRLAIYGTSAGVPSKPNPPFFIASTPDSITMGIEPCRPYGNDTASSYNNHHNMYCLQIEDPRSGHGFLTIFNSGDSTPQEIASTIERNKREMIVVTVPPKSLTNQQSATGDRKKEYNELLTHKLFRCSPYNFRLKLSNEDGSSPWSDVVTFSTAPGPPHPPKKLSLRGKPDTSSLKVTWVSPSDDGGSPICKYIVVIKDKLKSNLLREIDVGMVKECLVADLIAGHNYTIRVFAENAVGLRSPKTLKENESVQSCVLEVMTAPSVPALCSPPLIMPSSKSDTQPLSVSEANSTAELNQRTKNKLNNKDKNNPLSYKKSLSAATLLPTTLTSTKHPTCLSDKLKLTWVTPEHDGGSKILKYELQCGAIGSKMSGLDEIFNGDVPDLTLFKQDLAWQTIYTGPSLMHLLDHKTLAPATEYVFRVRCINAQGASPWSLLSQSYKTSISVPEAPASLDVILKSAHVATAHFKAPLRDNGCPISGYQLEMAVSINSTSTTPSPNPSNNPKTLNNNSHLNFTKIYNGPLNSYEIKNLVPCTTYLFRLAAFNSVGLGPFTNPPIKVHTSASVTSPIDGSTFSCVERGWNFITLKWDSPSDDRGSRVIRYAIEVTQLLSERGSHSSTSPYVSTGDISLLSAETPFSSSSKLSRSVNSAPKPFIYTEDDSCQYTIKDLYPVTTYKFRVQAINVIGTGPFNTGNPLIVTTLPTAPSLRPSIKRAPPLKNNGNIREQTNNNQDHHSNLLSSIGSSFVKIKWEYPAKSNNNYITNHISVVDNDANCKPEALSYQLEMSENVRKNNFNVVYEGDGTTTKICKLHENRVYHFRVRAFNEAGYGPYSEIHSFKTSWAYPCTVKNIKSPKVKIDSALITWNYNTSLIASPTNNPSKSLLKSSSSDDILTTWETHFELYLTCPDKPDSLVQQAVSRDCKFGNEVPSKNLHPIDSVKADTSANFPKPYLVYHGPNCEFLAKGLSPSTQYAVQIKAIRHFNTQHKVKFEQDETFDNEDGNNDEDVVVNSFNLDGQLSPSYTFKTLKLNRPLTNGSVVSIDSPSQNTSDSLRFSRLVILFSTIQRWLHIGAKNDLKLAGKDVGVVDGRHVDMLTENKSCLRLRSKGNASSKQSANGKLSSGTLSSTSSSKQSNKTSLNVNTLNNGIGLSGGSIDKSKSAKETTTVLDQRYAILFICIFTVFAFLTIFLVTKLEFV